LFSPYPLCWLSRCSLCVFKQMSIHHCGYCCNVLEHVAFSVGVFSFGPWRFPGLVWGESTVLLKMRCFSKAQTSSIFYMVTTQRTCTACSKIRMSLSLNNKCYIVCSKIGVSLFGGGALRERSHKHLPVQGFGHALLCGEEVKEVVVRGGGERISCPQAH